MQTEQQIVDIASRQNEQSNTPSHESDQSNSIAQDLIAQRAYEKWQQRGCPLGDDLHDWFAAESELAVEALSGVEQTGLERVAC